MSDDVVREADRYLAEGDYVRALDELGKAGRLDPEVSRRIQTALSRMKLVAAREFAVGRWSVAEGIFDAVGEHDRFLSPEERAECRALVDAIRRCRDEGRRLEGLVQAAADLAAQNQFPQSREVALEAMRLCGDPHLVARLRHLLRGLPHPLGRLIYGFDSAPEVERFAHASQGAAIECILNDLHPLGGGFARITLAGPGSRVDLMDPPADWSDGKDLCFVTQLASTVRATLRVSVGDLRNTWTHDVPLIDFYWNPVRLPLEAFRREGTPDWRAITRLSLTLAGPEPAVIHLDEVRLRSASPLGRA